MLHNSVNQTVLLDRLVILPGISAACPQDVTS